MVNNGKKRGVLKITTLGTPKTKTLNLANPRPNSWFVGERKSELQEKMSCEKIVSGTKKRSSGQNQP